jgi:hypothetical protein
VVIDETSVYLKYQRDVEMDIVNWVDKLIVSTAKNLNDGKKVDVVFKRTDIDDGQREAITGALNHDISIITGGPGTGKCLDPSTQLLMANGTFITAGEVQVGDQLMGDNSQPRNVLSITTGMDEMYEIIPDGGKSFICNAPHILTLTNKKDIIDLPLNEYLHDRQKYRDYRLYRCRVELPFHDVTLPYIRGSSRPREHEEYTFNSVSVRMDFFEGVCDHYGIVHGDKLYIPFSELEFLASTLGFRTWSAERGFFVELGVLGELPTAYWFDSNPPSSEMKFSVRRLGMGPYSGFTLDGNGRFLLSDCIVTHNTTIIGEIINNLETKGVSFAVGSFTGKAVARIRQATGYKGAQTLDRMITMNHKPFDHLIIDEISMVTSELLYRFINTFPFRFRVTLVGDNNQLPPISWGNIFAQLLVSDRVPTYRLFNNHRVNTKYSSAILDNAQLLIQPGRDMLRPAEISSSEDFRLIDGGVAEVETLVRRLSEENISKDSITVISPYNEHLKPLNEIFERIFLSSSQRTVDFEDNVWYVGTRIMMRVNNYDINVMNGEEGEVVGIKPEGLMCTFKGTAQHLFKYFQKDAYRKKDEDEDDVAELNTSHITKSFAITIHKSQGSEQSHVIVYIPSRDVSRDIYRFRNGSGHSSFLNVNLLYTAITRASQKLYLVGSPETILSTTHQPLPFRFDAISSRLKEMGKPEFEIEIAKIQAEQKYKAGITEDSTDTMDDVYEDEDGGCYLPASYFVK